MKGERKYVGIDIPKQRVFDVIKEGVLVKSVKFGNNNSEIEVKKECNWV